MSSLFLFAQDQFKTVQSPAQVQNDLNKRLREFSEQIKKDGVSIPDVLRPLTQHAVVQCVFGPAHLAFRLEDGRVCRVSYSLRTDRASSKADIKKNGSSRAESPNTLRDGSSGRTGTGQYTLRSYRSPLSMLSRTSRGISFLREMQRQGICLARPVASQISASEVPESLVEECQAVLEGKSRQLIIRELQHTNLDVNMAVNNLLSRDDETEQSNIGSGDGGTIGNGEDWEDDSVDILSLFEYPDGRMLLDSDSMIPDELIEPPTSPRPRGDLPFDYDCGFLSDRRKRRRIYSRTAEIYTSRTLGGSTDSTTTRSGLMDPVSSGAHGDENTDSSKQNSGSTRHHIQLGDQLEFWRGPDEQDDEIRFKAISALHSELVGLSIHGDLRQWRWTDAVPFVSSDTRTQSKQTIGLEGWEGISYESNARGPTVYYHPRVPSLDLLDDRVVQLSGCSTRATVLTSSGKLATWMDESLTISLPLSSSNSPQSSSVHSGLLSFEHRATHFPDLRDEVVVELRTAPLITVIRCLSGAVFWWGVYPPYMRQRTIERSRQHRTNATSRASGTSGIKSGGRQERSVKRAAQTMSSGVTPGTFVRMKSAPIFHAGAVGFTVVAGVPKVGILLEDAWKITDTCRFRVNTALSSTSSAMGLHNVANDGTSSVCGVADDMSQHILTCPHALSANTGGTVGMGSVSYPTHASASGSAAASPSVASGSDQLTNNGTGSLNFQEMPPPPSPASSTCSDQSGPVRVSPGTFKRKKVPSSSSDRGDCDMNSRTGRGRSADREFQSGSSSISGAIRRLSSSTDAPNQSTEICAKMSSENPSTPVSITIEEDWGLRDVIFVEDGRTQPVGIVLKVDGNIAAVKFLKDQERACLAANCVYSPVCNLVNSILSGNGGTQSHPLVGSGASGLTAFASGLSTSAMPDPMAWINDCRLLRKDDLAVVRYAGSSRVPEFVQRTPRRVPNLGLVRGTDAIRAKVLTLVPENNRIHVVVEQGVPPSICLAYQVYNLSGRITLNHMLPSTFRLQASSLDLENTTLTCPSEPPLLLRDGSGLVYPFVPSARSGSGAVQETGTNSLMFLDLPPVQCAAFAWVPSQLTSPMPGAIGLTSSSRGQANKSSTDQSLPTRCLLGLVIVRDLPLMQHVLRANDAQVERLLSPDNVLPIETTRNLAFEVVDGQRNLIHMAVTMCAPQSNCETSSEWAAKLDSVLSGPVQLIPFSSNDSKDRETKPDSANGSVNVRPSSTFWSSIARTTTTSQSSGLSMHELFIRSSIEAASVAAAAAAAAASTGGTQLRSDDRDPRSALANGTNFWHLPPVRKDDLTRRTASYRIIRLLLESRQLRPYLVQLLTARNTENLTPFMLAVKCRAYAVAQFIYETIQCLSLLPPSPLGVMESSLTSNDEMHSISREFFFPVDSHPDDSPLFLLCYNDTCSFTWTGPDHIRQDIFECRTCGLMDSLCCCTECARVCHRGHDCRLKRTSPTAYCDCWEKCRCQSLIAGAQAPRHELFYQLLRGTELIRLVNSRNEHLLLFLVKCVERQLREQKQYRPSRRRIGSVSGRSTGVPASGTGASTGTVLTSQGASWDCPREGGQAGASTGTEEPDHDLDPPRFARSALELALDSPIAVHSILSLDSNTRPTHYSAAVKSAARKDEENLVFTQAAATQLDDFVFTLICKCPTEMVDTLVSTINRHMATDVPGITSKSDRPAASHSFLSRPRNPSADQMRIVAGRFVRSVARIYTTMSLELTADHKKKKNRLLLTQLAPLDVCRHVFSRLAPVALVELPQLAAGLLTPVRTGTLRPSVPFSLMTQSADAVQGLEQFFALERSGQSRHRLLQLTDHQRIVESGGHAAESHGILFRSAEENRTNRSDAHDLPRTTYRSTTSELQTLPTPSSGTQSHRPTVVSSLHVQLSMPDESTSHTAVAVAEVVNTYNPTTFGSASLNDPSVLTMQMQSTIRDIDHDRESSGPHDETDHSDPRLIDSAHPFGMSEFSHNNLDNEERQSHTRSFRRSLRRPYDVLSNTTDAPDEGVCGPSVLEPTPDGGEQTPDTSSSVPCIRRPQIAEVYSTSDGYPKRRRTATPASGSPTRLAYEVSTFPVPQESNVSVPEEDESKVPYSLLDTDDPASQASSTGATVATIGGSTMDFDQGSDITNGSVETVFNNRVERTVNSEFTVNSLSLRPEQVESVPDLPTPVELTGAGRSDEFNYGELLNSVVNVYQSTLPESSTDVVGGRQVEDCLNSGARPLRMDYSNVDDASDGQVSDFDEDDDQDDGEDDDGDGNGDEDDEETEDEDAEEDGYNDDDGDELIEGEDDDDDDEENDDDSSHHSDASSIDAGSRSTSPTWTTWPRNSVFSRLSSRGQTSSGNIEDNNTPVTSSSAGLSVTSRRVTNTDLVNTSTNLTTTNNTASTAASGQPPARAGLNSGRRTVPSIISLLPTSSASNSSPALIVSTSGTSGTNALPNADSTCTPGSSSENGCIIHTQVSLSRAFGCLMRVIADLIVELHEDITNMSTMRRCASVPSAMILGPSVYEQQRQQHPYNTNAGSNANSVNTPSSSSGTNLHPLTLLLSSPMSSTNLTSSSAATLNARCFGPTLPDYQRGHLNQSGQTSGAHALNFGSSASALTRLTPTLRSTHGARGSLLSHAELAELVAAVGVVLCPIWQWLTHALDNLEAQLRYSAAWNAQFPGKQTLSIHGNHMPTAADAGTSTNSAIRRDWSSALPSSNRQSLSRSTTGRFPTSSSSTTGVNYRAEEDNHGSVQPTVLGQRHDFLSYVFSLMRATSGDHGDSVPFIGVPMHKHLAYVLDALVYFFKAFESAWPSGVMPQLMELGHTLGVGGSSHAIGVTTSQLSGRGFAGGLDKDSGPRDPTNAFVSLENTSQMLIGRMAQHEDTFFQRSESVLSLSGLGLDLVETALTESLPLALQPHRLHPTATRTDLFGSARFPSADLHNASACYQGPSVWPLQLNSGSSAWGDRVLGGGIRALTSDEKCSSNASEKKKHNTYLEGEQLLIGGGFLDSIGHPATLLSRWCLSLEFFGRHFSNDVGAEHRSYILELGGFTVKEARFRKHMERLRNTERRDLTLEVERERASLILGTVRQLNTEYAKRQSQTANQSPTSGGLSTPPAGIGRYSMSYNPLSQHSSSGSGALRTSASGNAPVAVAFLLGTTTDSPLLGTLFGASPAPSAPLTSSAPLSQNQPAILSCHRIKVMFKDEPGEGSGVARSFFTAFSEAILSQESLPQLNALLTPISASTATLTNTSTTPTTTTPQNYVNTPFHHRHYTSPGRPYGSLSAAASRVLTSSMTATLASNSTTVNSLTTNTNTSATCISRPGSPTRVTFSYSARSLDSSISVPVPIYSNHASNCSSGGGRLSSSRARTSAWRRAGGLSAQAAPFYPTITPTSVHFSALPPPPPPPPLPRLRLSRSRSPVALNNSLPASPTHTVASVVSGELPSVDQDANALFPDTSPSSQNQIRSDSVPLMRPSFSVNSTTASPSPSTASPASSRPISPIQSDPEHPVSAQTDINLLDQQSVGNRLFSQVYLLTRSNGLASRITGMLLELPATEHMVLLENDDALMNRVEEARAVLTMAEAGERDRSCNIEQPLSPVSAPQQQPILERLVKWRGSSGSATAKNTPIVCSISAASIPDCNVTNPERVPLFWQPGLQGYYFPRAVPGTNVTPPVPVDPVKLAFRYSLYRGVGRVIGLCLLTNETCPLHLSRPVLKYILGRVLHWHDFAFYDPTTFEGLRQLLRHTLPDQKEKLEGSVADYNLTFSLIPSVEEGGLNNEPGRPSPTNGSHQLAPQGDDIEVNESNVYEFVKRYTEFKMIEAVREPLEQMRLGVFDILPRNALDRLTAEDLRLLLNGAGEIDVDVLASYTTFHNETGVSSTDVKSAESVDGVARLKRWFWTTVRNMDNRQRQDLLYFWTSSPALPASSQGFQPMPSITIRPADDHHLPSANTCISRLYLPLYSSRHILREKLLQAIEVKSFGFV
ncbi:Hyperplastic disc [Fasciola hepatica]|uniref:Hyperplastic disc n=1 Tax=Fasciola hepatica TaxID=6192 RepID=A0A4E0R0R2_FASHE|nr:Hyperplastic disc [Fasciola hepatica]